MSHTLFAGRRMGIAQESLRESIAHQREELMDMLRGPLQRLANRCQPVWSDRTKLDAMLLDALKSLPYGKSLYALDTRGIQISSNAHADGLKAQDFGRDRSGRPYLNQVQPCFGALLSEAYISEKGNRPSLTAIQIVRDASGDVLGFIGTDFDLRDLPLTGRLYEEPVYWRQLKGDPSIRETVFHQNRVESAMDRQIDTVLRVVEELMAYHGIYHVMLHFSSSRAVVWVKEDPYRYRLLDIDALIDPNICLAYPKVPYPEDALVPVESLGAVLDSFSALRFMDDMFYLRTGTLNIFNGVVGLTFSCDGSHYVPFGEFLAADHAFWTNSP